MVRVRVTTAYRRLRVSDIDRVGLQGVGYTEMRETGPRAELALACGLYRQSLGLRAENHVALGVARFSTQLRANLLTNLLSYLLTYLLTYILT